METDRDTVQELQSINSYNINDEGTDRQGKTGISYELEVQVCWIHLDWQHLGKNRILFYTIGGLIMFE